MTHYAEKKPTNPKKEHRAGRYHDVVIFNKPDARFLLQVTNIIAYYLECVHDFIKDKSARNQNIYKAVSCAEKFSKLIQEDDNRGKISGTGLQGLNEFIMEAESVNAMIAKYRNSKVDIDTMESSLLYSKLYRLQYILTLLRQSLK